MSKCDNKSNVASVT